MNQIAKVHSKGVPKIKLCGMMRPEDIETVNELLPDYIGFIFWPHSKRNLTPEQAMELKSKLDPSVKAVGVFVDEKIEIVADFLQRGMIDVAQLHGHETEEYIATLRSLTDAPIFKAFKVRSREDVAAAKHCGADMVLLDAGYGAGRTFDWSLLQDMDRPFFLAGGLDVDNIGDALSQIRPYGVDVSSGIETDGKKDTDKMHRFVGAVREVGKS